MDERSIRKVEKYFQMNPTDELDFRTVEGNPAKLSKNSVSTLSEGEIDDAVLLTLKLTKRYRSYRKDEYQCRSSANRSSGDIWRHLKKYRPAVTILEVMASLRRLSEDGDDVTGFVCGDIQKRVFYIEEDEGGWSRGDTDEYGLGSGDW